MPARGQGETEREEGAEEMLGSQGEAASGELGTTKGGERDVAGADVLQVQKVREGWVLCSIARRWSLGVGRGDKGWDGDGLRGKMWMNLKQTELVMGCLGARLDWAWIGWGWVWVPNL